MPTKNKGEIEGTKSDCAGVVCKNSFETLGRFDVINIVKPEDLKQVEKAAMIIHAYRHSTTATVVATR